MAEPEELDTIQLGEGEAWIWDVDSLAPDSGTDSGVLAVVNKDGQLFVLTAKDRKWHPADEQPQKARIAAVK